MMCRLRHLGWLLAVFGAVLNAETQEHSEYDLIAGVTKADWLFRGGEWSVPWSIDDPEMLKWRRVAVGSAEALADFALACLVSGAEVDFPVGTVIKPHPPNEVWQAIGIFRMLDGHVPLRIESQIVRFLENRSWTSTSGGRGILAGALGYTKCRSKERLLVVALEDLESGKKDRLLTAVTILYALVPYEPRAVTRLFEILRGAEVDSPEFTAAAQGLAFQPHFTSELWKRFGDSIREILPVERRRKILWWFKRDLQQPF